MIKGGLLSAGAPEEEQIPPEGAAPVEQEQPAPPPSGRSPSSGSAPVESDELSDEDGEPATPEEQQMYDMFFDNGLALIYDEQGTVRSGIVDLLKMNPAQAAQDQAGADPEMMKEMTGPPTVLANATVTVVIQLVQGSKEQGVEIPGFIVLEAGKDLLSELADIMANEGIHDLSQDEMNAALVKASQLYLMVAEERGLIDKEALAQEFEQFKQADAAGEFGPGPEPKEEPEQAQQGV